VLSVYAIAIEAAVHGCIVVATYSLNIVQLSPNTGYVEGEIMVVDGSRLAFFEFLRWGVAGSDLDREKYRYHFMDTSNQLIFRYDNAPHHREVATFPHHKHSLTGVTNSIAPRFAEVLAEIETHVMRIP